MRADAPGAAAWIAEPDGAAFDTSGWNGRLARLYAHWRGIHPAPRKGTPTPTIDPYWHSSENVMMPLAQDGREVDMLLCASVFYGHDGRVL